VNARGNHKIPCDCHLQAKEMAVDMNLHAATEVIRGHRAPSLARLAAMQSQLDQGPVDVKPFCPPEDETMDMRILLKGIFRDF
jgi:hypothetical protein